MQKLRAITADEIIALGRKHPGTYQTIGRRIPFTVKPWHEDGIIFGINRNTRHEGARAARLDQYVEIFNRERSYHTSPFRTQTAPFRKFYLTSYFLGLVRALQEYPVRGEELLKRLSQEEKEILSAPRTEREELRKSRVGQGRFRRDVIKLRGRCYVTGLEHVDFLRASHIKPWSESDNEERLDPNNGLLLAPNYDHLFDAACISFRDDGRILVAPNLPSAILTRFMIDTTFKGRPFNLRTRRYLVHHRARYRARAGR